MTKKEKGKGKREPVLEKKPSKALDKNPIRVLPKISFEVFSQVSGVKWDQLAGLKYYAKKKSIRLLTVPEWQALHEEYKKKPVK